MGGGGGWTDGAGFPRYPHIDKVSESIIFVHNACTDTHRWNQPTATPSTYSAFSPLVLPIRRTPPLALFLSLSLSLPPFSSFPAFSLFSPSLLLTYPSRSFLPWQVFRVILLCCDSIVAPSASSITRASPPSPSRHTHTRKTLLRLACVKVATPDLYVRVTSVLVCVYAVRQVEERGRCGGRIVRVADGAQRSLFDT